MRITRGWRGGDVTIAEAVKLALDTSDHGSGQLEDLTGNQREASEMLGKIIDKLHAKGIFTDADVKDLIGWKFTVSSEAAE